MHKCFVGGGTFTMLLTCCSNSRLIFGKKFGQSVGLKEQNMLVMDWPMINVIMSYI